MSTFEEVMSEISHGKPLDLDAEERVSPDETQDQDPEKAKGEEVEGKLDEEPESEAEEETTPDEGDPKSEDGEEPADEPDAEEPAKEEEPEKLPETVTIDGQEVTLEQLREWRDQGLRLDDYTRKTMETSDLKRQLAQERKDQRELAQSIADDSALQQFLAARPGAIAHLMASPKDTRSLIGNPKAVENFWADYDLVKDNPRIAEKILSHPDEGEKELRFEQERQTMGKVVSTLDQFIDSVREQYYPEVDSMQVKEYTASLAGMPDEPSHEDMVAGVSRLFGLFFRQDGDQWNIDHRLIKSEFDRLQGSVAEPQEEEEEKEGADEHNKNVDAQLKDDEMPPKTPGGQAPYAESEKKELPKSFEDVLQKLQSGAQL